MKVPSEAELIELEDWLSYQFREPQSLRNNWFRRPRVSEDQALDSIRNLIAIARRQAPPIPPMPRQPPRTSVLEPSPPVRPKPEKEKHWTVTRKKR